MEIGYLLKIVELKLDYWSIGEQLYEIEYCPQDDEKRDAHAVYEDQFHDLSILAADLIGDLNRLINQLNYAIRLPSRTLAREGLENYQGIAWFNMAASILSETDLSILLENECSYDPEDVENERCKRRRAVLALTKETLFMLLTETFHILTRYIKLEQTYGTVCCAADELEHQRAAHDKASAPSPNEHGGEHDNRS